MEEKELPPKPLDLLAKVDDLNVKIDHLKEVNRKIAEQHTLLKEKEGRFSLDFIHSSDLEEIEKGIQETVEGVMLSRAAICKSLANIDTKKLYHQAGCRSFMGYLKEERIPIKYKTAKEYAKIGDTLMRHAEGLAEVDFREEDGLKKLIFLDKALRNYRENPRQVYKKIKEYSLREFRSYAAQAKKGRTGADPDRQDDLRFLRSYSSRTAAEYFEAENRSVYRCTSAGNRITVVKITDPEMQTDKPEFKTYLLELRKLTERYFSRIRNSDDE